MDITGNFLDITYNKNTDIPIILAQLASRCVTVALTSPSSCPLASASMKKPDPAAEIVVRINAIASALSSRGYYVAEDKIERIFSIFDLSDNFPSLPRIVGEPQLNICII
jgi:hypothetical protein